MTDDDAPDIRRMQRGSWFWVDKAVIRHYGSRVGVFGVAVYNCLASFANARQTCYPSQDRIAAMLGCSRASVNRAIKTLETHGLIALERRGRCPHLYRLLGIRCNSTAALLTTTDDFDVTHVRTNNNKRTRYINNGAPTKGDVHRVNHKAGTGPCPAVQSEALALELADALDDRRNLSLYLFYSRRYSESLLRSVTREVLAVPLNKIKKSRAALFRYLVDTYAKRETDNPGY